jgi:hypothetical protein
MPKAGPMGTSLAFKFWTRELQLKYTLYYQEQVLYSVIYSDMDVFFCVEFAY